MSVTGQSRSGYRKTDSSAVAEPDVAAEQPDGAEQPGIAKPRTGHGWGVAMVRHRRLVVALWVLLLIASGALYPSLRRALGAPDYRVAGSQSTRVEQLLEKRFPNVGSEDDALVFHSRGHTASDRTYTQFVESLLATLAHRPGVRGVLSPFSTEAIGQISSDEHSLVAAVALTGTSQQRFENASRLQSVAMHAAAATHGAVQAWLTGYSPVTRDMVHVQTVDVERAEAIGVPVAFVVLLFALGSLVAAAIPLALAGAGLLLTYGVLALIIKVSHFDNFLISIVAMVGVGIGIDYALIIVSRFREEFARQRAPGGEDTQTLGGEDARVADAVGVAISTAGRTILFSGVICALAITAMLVLRAAVFREITVGVVAVVACTLLAALTLLPAVLGMLGSRIDRGSLPARMQPADARADGGERMGGWARWALAVMAHPIVAIVASTAILLVSAAPALGLRYGLNLGVFTVSEAASGKGEQALARSFAPGAVSPMQIILTGPHDNGTSADANAARSLTETLERDSRVAGVSERSQLRRRAAQCRDLRCGRLQRGQRARAPHSSGSRAPPTRKMGRHRACGRRDRCDGGPRARDLHEVPAGARADPRRLAAVPAGGVPQSPPRREGDPDEPARHRRDARDRRLRLPGRTRRTPLRLHLNRVHPVLRAAHGVRARIWPLDGLRGVPDPAHPGRMEAHRRQPPLRRRGAWSIPPARSPRRRRSWWSSSAASSPPTSWNSSSSASPWRWASRSTPR